MKKAIAILLVLLILPIGFAEKGHSKESSANVKAVSVISEKAGEVSQKSGAEEIKSAEPEEEGISENLSKAPQPEKLMPTKTTGSKPAPNKIVLAVHTLLSVADAEPGIGENISAIAREFNNSVKSTSEALEAINSQPVILKYFFGGKVEEAKKIEEQIQKNEELLQKLNQTKEMVQNATVRETIDEQIRAIEEEQEKLKSVAEREKKYPGWLKRFFNFILKRNA